jgi:hypothetical protein
VPDDTNAPGNLPGDHLAPAVQLIDTAAAKAKAGAEEVMQEAAAERSGAARPESRAGTQDRDEPKQYRASRLERESAKAASTRSAVSGDRAGAEPAVGADEVAAQVPARTSAEAGPSQAGPAPARLESDGAAEPPSGGEAIQVSVVPGITRYHRSDCLLIRFLTADDLEVMTKQAAIDSGCVACKACKPDQETADLQIG